MGSTNSPQYQDTKVNIRMDAANDAGNAYVLNVFLSAG